MLAKDTFLKKIKLTNLLFFFFIFFHFENIFADQVKAGVIKHINSLNNFSANFIQSNDSGINIEEGVIFIGEKRIKVQYNSPSKVTIVLDKRRSMYFNRDLQEVEYFNTKKSEASIFFEILKNKNFLNNTKITIDQKNVVIKKTYSFDKNVYLAELFFEQNPYLLRKIKVSFNETFYTISFFNHSYNQEFRKKFFSLVNPLIIN